MKNNNKKICVIFTIFFILFASQVTHSQVLNNYQKVSQDIFLLDDFGCNVAVLHGHDGVLIVDSGSPRNVERLKAAVKEISEESISLIINTHFHFDHVGGNEIIAKEANLIFAHKNTRTRMSSEWDVPEILRTKWPVIPAYPELALPKVCYNDSILIHFNGDKIQCIHVPQAHSDCDAIIYFQKANVIHTGDLYLSNGYPIIDIYHGGTINGLIGAVDKVIKLCDENTTVIPGHGPLSNRAQLKDYHNMLITARDRIAKHIKDGKTLEEVLALDPTANLYKGGKSWLPAEHFVYVTYHDLSK